MPRKSKVQGGFRFKGKKIGLTYSAPIDPCPDNPIVSNQELLEYLTGIWGESKYIIAEEKHESGKRHYHVYMHLDTVLDKSKSDFADFKADDDRPWKHVHPNILQGVPGPGWMAYCKKDKEYITNMAECSYREALALPSATEAVEHLWARQPRQMCLSGHLIEQNLAKRFKPAAREAVTYCGPYPRHYYPDAINMDKYSVCLYGPKETHKSQFAKYYMAHRYGPTGFIKSHKEALKKIDLNLPWILDEVDMLKHDPIESREITDVENGGTILCLYKAVDIPPGPRMFTSNLDWPFKNPAEAVYDRRVIMLHIPAFAEAPASYINPFESQFSE